MSLAKLTFFIIAIVLFYFELTWLGFVFIVLGIISLLWNPTKNQGKEVWEQVKKAETKDVSGEFKGYIDNASKLAAEGVTPVEGTQYQITSPKKLHPTSKNFFSELKKLFE
jgi:predicted membrane protein